MRIHFRGAKMVRPPLSSSTYRSASLVTVCGDVCQTPESLFVSSPELAHLRTVYFALYKCTHYYYYYYYAMLVGWDFRRFVTYPFVWGSIISVKCTSNLVCWLILTSTTTCMIGYPKRMCSGSRDLISLSEITDNISETVQDRDILTTVH